ncbi:unnamed protein product [Fraxinus pennsylvanica]|uniref:Formiminotransferase N-terminal subdomain domain-containing protein n=1 Tax=Fraxinus pennsylvanica TaxID=56036 RepID=A0AAD1Z7F3_9LAMI|nr:unnamed protein product [Fraxinus pennsylvanica]
MDCLAQYILGAAAGVGFIIGFGCYWHIRSKRLPVYLYGAAHPTGKALDAIRRELGYYRPNSRGNQWAGWTQPEILPERPNEGPNTVTRARGIAMIGARSWVATYNVPILSTDVSIARRIA